MTSLNPSEKFTVALFCSISIICYLLTLLFALHNVYYYLIREKRYKSFGGSLILMFYLLSVLDLLIRLT